MNMYSQRTYQDMKRWNPLIGSIYYVRNPKNPKEIRTYHMRWNGLANRITPAISNWVQMEPTEEMKPYNPRVMSAVETFQPQQQEFY